MPAPCTIGGRPWRRTGGTRLPGRRWARRRFAGRPLVVAAEQGFGDAIWAARFLPRAKALGGEVVPECRPELETLLAGPGCVDRFVPKGAGLPDAAWHVPPCSLPGLSTPDLAAVDGAPCLTATGALPQGLAPMLAEAGDRLRVGIVWSGSTTFKANADRALGLDRLLAALALPGVAPFAFQKGEPAAELAGHRGAGVFDVGPLLGDFADTAAVVGAMDLIVMTDSAMARLAGALGKPVWVLLASAAYWLWLDGRDDGPRYGGVRLFRRTAPGDRDDVLDRVAAGLLEKVMAGRATCRSQPRTARSRPDRP